MKKFLVSLMLMSFLMSMNVELGRYQLSVSIATSSKGKVYVIETVIDIYTGEIVSRDKISLYRYKKMRKTYKGRLRGDIRNEKDK